MSDADDALVAEAVRYARARTDRWTVRTLVKPGRPAVEFSHPLSAGLQYVFSVGPPVPSELRRFAQWLESTREVGDIEACPTDLPHSSLLRALRGLASGYGLGNPLCHDLAARLCGHGCLSEDEAAWFRGHTGHGAPGTPLPP